MRWIHTRVERMCFAGVSSGLATVVLSVLLLSCSDPTGPVREPRNTFTDWQHIQGKVCGVWTKDHNPHVISVAGISIEDGDSLVVKEGVEIITSGSIDLVARGNNGYLKFLGTKDEPIRWVLTYGSGALFSYGGSVTLKYVILEGNQNVIEIGGGASVSNSNFVESGLVFILNETSANLPQRDSVKVLSSIFSGFRYWDPNYRRSIMDNVDYVRDDGYLDSSLTDIRNNLFFGPIGDSLPTGGPLVNVRYKGASGIRTISGMAWPGNGNIYANPQWVRYSYIGPNPTGLSDNDYHLLPGSPAMGAGADGGNIGAY